MIAGQSKGEVHACIGKEKGVEVPCPSPGAHAPEHAAVGLVTSLLVMILQCTCIALVSHLRNYLHILSNMTEWNEMTTVSKKSISLVFFPTPNHHAIFFHRQQNAPDLSASIQNDITWAP
jgi:hypothetical protein